MNDARMIVAGFIPLLDCAPLVAATECGFATEEGLDLTLVRETSWANIRDRIVVGHFDAAHMLGPMAVASTLGIGHLRMPLVAPFSFGLGGNGITVSRALWQQMLEHGARVGAAPDVQGAALRQVVANLDVARREPLTFAMVYPFSSHNYLLRYWLAAVGIDPDRDVRLVVLPPPLLVDAMREGQIDGFCVGEPWNSLAVSVGVGCIVAATGSIWHHSPEKVLACRLQWARRNPESLTALVRALARAAQWCSTPRNHAELARLLAAPRFVGAPAEILMRGLSNHLVLVASDPSQHLDGFYTIAEHGANSPRASHAAWFYSQMVRWRQVEFSEDLVSAACATYRPDLYRDALGLGATPADDTRLTGFFDGRVFDAGNLSGYLRAFSASKAT